MTIVSLLPEAREILHALNLAPELAALPDGADAAPDALADALAAIHPRLIFTSETAAGGGMPRAVVRRLVRRLRPRPAVYALEPHTLGDILSDIKTVGDATGQQRAARALIEALRARIDAVTLRTAQSLAARPAPRVALLAHGEPPTAAGWWLAELIGLAGGHDVLAGLGRPPRAVTQEEIEAARPDVVLRVADLRGRGGEGLAFVHLLERLSDLLAGLPTN
ncbi:MAG: ABC transporter substrate-binding protein [Chloroflexi bacterium]|nr:ABC transporter substrate-binding protein [Chloroflexota bacterium]